MNCFRNFFQTGRPVKKSSFTAARRVVTPPVTSQNACAMKLSSQTFSFCKAAGKDGPRRTDEENDSHPTLISLLSLAGRGRREAAGGGYMKFFWRIVDLILGGLFIYAGVIKALDPVQFANNIDNYKTLPWF